MMRIVRVGEGWSLSENGGGSDCRSEGSLVLEKSLKTVTGKVLACLAESDVYWSAAEVEYLC